MRVVRQMSYRLSVVLFLLITFVSCVSISPAIPPTAMDSVQSVDIYIGHPEESIVYQRQAKGAKAGAVIAGLLGILIVETISRRSNSKWEKPGQRVAAHFDHLDHAGKLEKLLMHSLDQTGIQYTIHRVNELHDLFQRTEVIEEILENTTSDIVIALSYDYNLQQGFDLHVSGHSEAYAVSDSTQQFADTRQRIVYRLLDDMVLMENDRFTSGSPDEIANTIIEADRSIIAQQLDVASQRVVAEVIGILGRDTSGSNERQYTSSR